MIYKTEDIISAAKRGDFNVLVHQCNCFNTFGAGVARAIKKEFPEAYEADLCTIKGDKNKLGLLTYTYIEKYDLYIFNLYGQYHYSRSNIATDYNALDSALSLMVGILASLDSVKIGAVKLGCGLGGGDWSKVLPLMEHHLSSFDVTIYDL